MSTEDRAQRAVRKAHDEADELRRQLDDAIVRNRQLEAAAAQLAQIRLVFDAFDWETDDRQYALEQIEQIVNGDSR